MEYTTYLEAAAKVKTSLFTSLGHDMRVAILFGAGATFGTGNVLPYPPPLGANLYAELTHEFPQSGGAVPSGIAQLFEKNQFEDAMAAVWDTPSALVQQLLIDMTVYFSRFRAGDSWSDCFSQLIDVLITTRLCRSTGIATLNYECVLDEVMARAGRSLTYLAPNPTARQSVVWKEHGACNLLAPLAIYNSTMVSVSHYYEGPIEVYPVTRIREKYESGYSLPAAMSLFAKGKHTPVASEFVGAGP